MAGARVLEVGAADGPTHASAICQHVPAQSARFFRTKAPEQQPLWRFSPDPFWGAGGWRCVTVHDLLEKVRQLLGRKEWQDRDLVEYWTEEGNQWLLYEKGHVLGCAMHAYAYYLHKHKNPSLACKQLCEPESSMTR